MGLLDRLQAIGSRLKLIQAAPAPKGRSVPVKVHTRTVSIDDLTAELSPENRSALGEVPEEITAAFATVFEKAGVTPPAHAWTVERLEEVLRTPPYKAMGRATVQKTIAGLLGADKAQVEDVVKDAIARDKALDAFATLVQQRSAERRQARDRRTAEIDAQIRRLAGERQRLEEEAEADGKRLEDWLTRKAAYEEDMAWAIGYLVADAGITIDRPAKAGK